MSSSPNHSSSTILPNFLESIQHIDETEDGSRYLDYEQDSL